VGDREVSRTGTILWEGGEVHEDTGALFECPDTSCGKCQLATLESQVDLSLKLLN
jgi:hypothetical protein